MASARMLVPRLFALAAVIVTAASCDSTSSLSAVPSNSPKAASMSPYWDGGVREYVGEDVTSLPGVIVRDQFGRPIGGVTVTFAVTTGGGTLRPGVVVTRGNGVATLEQWKLGPVIGENIVTATAETSFSVLFSKVSLPPEPPCPECDG